MTPGFTDPVLFRLNSRAFVHIWIITPAHPYADKTQRQACNILVNENNERLLNEN